MKPYIAISGVVNLEQIKAIGEIKEKLSIFQNNYDLCIGFQVSKRTLYGGQNSKRQPDINTLQALCNRTKELGMIPSIHYHTKTKSNLVSEIIDLNKEVQYDYLQLNVKDCSPKILQYPDRKLIYKGSFNYDTNRNFNVNINSEFTEVEPFIDYLMFDTSHGKGLPFNIRQVFYYGFITECYDFDYVIAGGFNPINIEERLIDLRILLKPFSIDAESGLRTKDDLLNLDSCASYLRSCDKILGSLDNVH